MIDGLGVEAPYPIDVVIKAAGIVLLAVYAGLHRRWLLAAGLALGAAGDVFLALQPSQVAAGIASFGLGHLVYVALFIGVWRREGRGGNAGAIAAVALAVFGVVMLILLQPHFGELRVAASVYNAVIIVMACLALIARSPKLAWIGALLFVASDTILALRMFAHVLPWAGPVVWISYYLGQAGIALGLSRDEPRAG
nr:lysoplasmalogenase [Pseudenhygromyxa sp. WMMC2535]